MNERIAILNSEISLFPVGLGTVDAGIRWDGADADAVFNKYLAMGGNLIDSARVYSDWIEPEVARSERVIGDWLRRSGRRNEVVLVTKGGHPNMKVEHPDLHLNRMNKADMESDLNASLKSLQTDYIDIYFYHRDNLKQPVEQLIDVMENFVRQGKIRYYACSNWSTDRMQQADSYCKRMNYRGLIANQALYNVGSQYMLPVQDDTMVTVDDQMVAYHKGNSNNILMPYMGVCSGFFHQYLLNGRDTVNKNIYCTEGNLRFAERLPMLMEKYNATVTQLVLGYFMVQEFPCIPLYGPMIAENLEDALSVVNIDFDAKDYIF